ncbi:MAG: EamA family transporter, partial [Anaerolineae bacterium]
IANSAFKLSSQGRTPREFLLWQVVGNLSGFIAVLIFTLLLRYLPLHVAFPLIQGLAIIGIQVAAASWLFHEVISPAHWLGTGLIIAGILILGSR